MGIVYKARDPLIGRIVAVKRVSLGELLPEEERAAFHERFLREARAAGGLKHPNIVVVHDVGEHDGLPFMAMEYLEGGSLASLMKSHGAIPIEDSLATVRQVAAGLAYAHKRGIIHRDVKPDNILLDKDGRAVITDFGAARLQNSELTRTGEVLGTPYYMSPEQILGKPLDGRSDLFSLGVIFYLMVTGKRPFKGDTITTICYHIVHSEPEPISPDLRLPAFVLALLDKLLSKNRDGRFASGEELIAAIDALAGSPPTVKGVVSLTQTLEVPTPVPPIQGRVPAAPASSKAEGFPPAGPSCPGASHPSAPSQPSGFPPSYPSDGSRPSGERSQKLLIGGLALGSLLALSLAIAVVGLVVAYFVWLRPAPAEPTLPVSPPTTQPVTSTPQVPAVAQPQPSSAPEPAQSQPSPAPRRAQPPRVREPGPPPLIHEPQPPATYVQTGGVSPAPVRGGEAKPYPVTPAAPLVPTFNPAVAASTEALAQEAANAAEMAKESHFGQAFRALDDVQQRMDSLVQGAGAPDQAAIERARAKVDQAQAEALRALADWARPLVERAKGTYTVATDRINDDEEGIERAYAQLYPVLKWKDRLPPDLKQAAITLVQNCRENLNDDEWAEAEALAKGEKKD